MPASPSPAQRPSSLRTLRDSRETRIADAPNFTSEPPEWSTHTRSFTNELAPCTFEPEVPQLGTRKMLGWMAPDGIGVPSGDG